MVTARRCLIVCIFLSTVSLFAQENDGRQGFEEARVFPKNYYLRGDILHVRKSRPQNRVLAYSSISKETSFSTKDMNFSPRYGFKVTASKILTPIRNIELSYARVRFDRTWQALDRTQTDYSSWVEQPISHASYQFISKLQDTELKFMNQLGANFLIFTGLRYVYLPEEIRINQRFPLGSCELAYSAQTKNSVAGPELGFTFLFPSFEPILCKFFMKTGIFVNVAKQISKASLSGDPSGGSDPGFSLSRVSKSNISFSTINEAKFEIVGKFTDWFRAYLGYDLLLITGLALAQDQLVQRLLFPFPASLGNTGLNVNDQIIHTRGRNFYQIANFGIEFRW